MPNPETEESKKLGGIEMVIKGAVRNEHRLAFREGKKEGIPADQLAILEAEAEAQKPEVEAAKAEHEKAEKKVK